MMKNSQMISRALFAVFVALYFNPSIVTGQDSVPQPAFKEGDYWKFNYKMSGGASVSSNLPPGTYTVVFNSGKLVIEGSDTEKSGLDIFALAVPGLSTFGWYEFPLSKQERHGAGNKK